MDAAEAEPEHSHDLEFFFNPVCPYAWQASVWIRRVAELRDLTIRWRFVCLTLANEMRKDGRVGPSGTDDTRTGKRLLRIAAAVRDAGGNDAVGALYRAWGEAIWYESGDPRDCEGREGWETFGVDLAAELAELGLDPALAEAAHSSEFEDVITAETMLAFERTGPDVGTPIITYNAVGASFFGPVLPIPPERDEDALRLYDLVSELAGYGGFTELKRSKRPPLALPSFAPPSS